MESVNDVNASDPIETISNDPALCDPIIETLGHYWVQRGPSMCQNNDRSFAKSVKIDIVGKKDSKKKIYILFLLHRYEFTVTYFTTSILIYIGLNYKDWGQ